MYVVRESGGERDGLPARGGRVKTLSRALSSSLLVAHTLQGWTASVHTSPNGLSMASSVEMEVGSALAYLAVQTPVAATHLTNFSANPHARRMMLSQLRQRLCAARQQTAPDQGL